MSREWKPGAMALIRYLDSEVVAMRGVNSWSFADTSPVGGFSTTYDHSGRCEPIRPLVVIDLEDREQVERLVGAIETTVGGKAGATAVRDMQAALRAFVNPQPSDPKARVIDRRDNYWRLLADGDWVCVDGPDIGEYIVWSQLVERGPLEVQP